MNKLIFLTIIFGCFNYTYTLKYSSSFMDDVEELDLILLTSTWDVNKPHRFNRNYLPTTPKDIMESWCKPMMDKTMRAMDLIERMFKHNTILLILNRISVMTQLNMGSKLCNNPQIISKVTHYNRMTNKIIPRLIPWYKRTLNTYLSITNPESEVNAGQIICLMKKSCRRLLAAFPPNMREGLVKYMTMVNMKNGQMIEGILNHMNIDTNVNACHFQNRPVPNPLGIKSIEMAALIAWDRALSRHNM